MFSVSWNEFSAYIYALWALGILPKVKARAQTLADEPWDEVTLAKAAAPFERQREHVLAILSTEPTAKDDFERSDRVAYSERNAALWLRADVRDKLLEVTSENGAVGIFRKLANDITRYLDTLPRSTKTIDLASILPRDKHEIARWATATSLPYLGRLLFTTTGGNGVGQGTEAKWLL